MNYILTPADPPDRKTMGGKAAALCELGKDFPIPEWFVIRPQAFFDSLNGELSQAEAMGELRVKQEVLDEIAAAMRILGTTDQLFAVRSSTVEEDGAELSFAGQFESHLNVPPEQIASKVIEVWRSAFKSGVNAYREQANATGNPVAPAVLVQKMVNAEVAGVIFSADPVSGDRETCVVIATAGLADRLVAGEVNGDTYHIDRDGNLQSQVCAGDVPCLDSDRLRRVLQLALQAERFFDCPQDVEWAMEGERLYLLQSRPITTLKKAGVNGASRILWDNSNIVESYSGVTTPLTYSFARYVYEAVYIEFCRLMGISEKKIAACGNAFRNMLGYVNGHIYYNLLNWYRVLSLFPGFSVNRAFMEQMMGVDRALPPDLLRGIVSGRRPRLKEKVFDIVNIARAVAGMLLNIALLPVKISRFYRRLQLALDLRGRRLEDLPLDRLAEHYRALEARLLSQWDAPLINDFFCMIAFGLSRKLLDRYAGEAAEGLHNDFMIGQGDIISAEPARRIKRMAAIVAADPDLQVRLSGGEIKQALGIIEQHPQLSGHYRDYLDKFGDRCLQELKLESPTLHDDPSTLIAAIVNLSRQKSGPDESARTPDPLQRLGQIMRGKPLRHRLIRLTLNWAKKRIQQRENLRFERTRVFGRVRRVFVEIGRRLHEQQLLDEPRDIFYLEVAEILGLIEGSITSYDLRNLVACRRKIVEDFSGQAAPPNRFETRGAVLPALLKHDWILDTQQATSGDENSRTGLGCCPGVVRAGVRVIDDPRGAVLEPGEIMVARHTDPGWITLFANAAGILVERGSLLSHSAIVAREMGIPAIVSIAGVTDWLRTGDRVEMDGATGTVRRIQQDDGT
ncbi:MAG TPA: PEP/pyruvate-binding domain-containing protein [Gammaproteobacteria bacterium]